MTALHPLPVRGNEGHGLGGFMVKALDCIRGLAVTMGMVPL